MSDNDKKITDEKPLRMVWGDPDEVPAVYANHAYISHAGTEFHLYFGHVSPPITLGLEEDELPDRVEIKPVAKIVLSPEAMMAIIEAMNRNLETYQKKVEGTGETK